MSDQQQNPYAVTLKNVRLRFENVFTPFKGEGKYSATVMLHKEADKDTIKLVQGLIKKMLEEEYRGVAVKPAGDKLCLRDGDNSGRAELAGYWTLSASESTKPVVVHKDRSPLTAEDDVIYPGCFVNVSINLWAQKSQQWGNRINANLRGVQFVGAGERFAGSQRYTAEQMFDALDVATENDPFA